MILMKLRRSRRRLGVGSSPVRHLYLITRRSRRQIRGRPLCQTTVVRLDRKIRVSSGKISFMILITFIVPFLVGVLLGQLIILSVLFLV